VQAFPFQRWQGAKDGYGVTCREIKSTKNRRSWEALEDWANLLIARLLFSDFEWSGRSSKLSANKGEEVTGEIPIGFKNCCKPYRKGYFNLLGCWSGLHHFLVAEEEGQELQPVILRGTTSMCLRFRLWQSSQVSWMIISLKHITFESNWRGYGWRRFMQKPWCWETDAIAVANSCTEAIGAWECGLVILIIARWESLTQKENLRRD